MEEVHLYIGSESLPRDNEEFTVAPGQYGPSADGNKPDDENPLGIIDDTLETDVASLYTWTVNWEALFGDLYIVAHAVVCGEGLGGGNDN
jgi:hypothetical protein